ncbi:amino acid adenylation domain-containing protein [Candidatus Albibeggiatoa sp. nov. NOAA]|uniref:amino acid adenylation domain-containing protein n=1 Tax=Candidatus Albibeggiatoa sp. nov. NOAA TaxID=3162724 RepID=UPI0032F67973|nr:amino acid adenylation domain-containing protein [Thiotrichaceae bacterium]
MDRKNIEAIYPLSPLQKGILFDSLYSPDTLSYFVQVQFGLEQPNTDYLKQAWFTVQQRHAVLRSLFIWDKQKQPLQIVLKDVELDWILEDWQHDDKATQQIKLQQLLQQDKEQGFTLNKAPLMRCYLIQLSAQNYHFIWSHHHIILDGWSLPIILQEVLAVYQALNQGQTPQLPALRPFKDYIQWLQKRNNEQVQQYWTNALSGITAPTPLGINKPVQAATQYAEQCFDFSKELSTYMQQFVREQRITVNTLLQAAWALVLSNYSRNQDILFGGMVSGRPAELQQIEKMVGLFANTIPIRIQIDNQQTIQAWLAQLHAEQVAREEFSYHGLIDIQQWSDMPSGVNLFDSVVVTENYPIDKALTAGHQALQIQNFEMAEHANSALILVFSLHQDVLSARIIYAQNQFETDVIQRLFEHLTLTLQYLLKDKTQRVNPPMLLTDAEQGQILAWNQTQKNYPHACLHQLFERQVQATPDAIAAIYADQQLTYAQLNTKANQLAHYLNDLGVKTEDFVGIYTERSLEMMIGLLGILKAGAAYVPLDPNYPAERIAFMLQDAQPPVLLTQQHLLLTLPKHQAHTICLDADWANIAKQSEHNPNIAIELNQLAYMIYTSGSTGKPKGVMNSHLAISNRLLWMQDAYQLTVEDTVLQKTSFSFDVSVWEFFWPLLAGAKVVFAKPEGHKDAAYLAQLIQQTQVTTLHFVPSMLQLFLQTAHLNQCDSLRQVFCSGETLPVDLQNKFFDIFPTVALHNLYGPTEAAVDVTHWQCQPDKKRHTVPIGQPINNIQIHILDHQLRPVPIGIAGELHITGIGVARGYHNRPTLSAEKFIDNPFSQPTTLSVRQPESASPLDISVANKLYKTGDLARWSPEGYIEYLGRLDHQVKIRGFRIELGEIEAAITQHPQVSESIVLVKEGNDLEEKQLVAFIVPEQAQDNSKESEYIKQVSEIYHHTYGEVDEQATDFNIAGWNSSYTGKAIPEAEMQEWVQCTVQRILALQPQQLVEIGCGTGLLLSRIAPQCQAYMGLDLSAEAISHVTQLQKSHSTLQHITLQQAPADDFSAIAADTYDTLVINSVVQHFPSVHYFSNVLKQAVAAVRDGGRIFVGDIRSFGLLETYHASVQLYQANEETKLTELRKQIDKQLAQEEELVIDPHFFTALQVECSRIQHIEIYPKRGEFDNELTKFRFDVVLHIGRSPELCDVTWQDWQPQWDLTAIREHLTQKQPQTFGLRHISNLRLVEENALLQQPTQATVAEFRAQFDTAIGLNPEALWQLAEQLGYQVELSWLNTNQQGQFSAVFKHATLGALVKFDRPSVESDEQLYANAPLQQSGLYQQHLISDVKKGLHKQLPDYMRPAHYVVLEQLPLTPNGKVNRKALLETDMYADRDTSRLCSARDNIEKALVAIWQEELNVHPIGVTDNFFELGGHSLLAIRMMSKIQQQFGQNLPLATLFEGTTIESLARIIRGRITVSNWQPVVKIQPNGDKTPLYCVPGAGGNVLYDYELAHALGDERPFYGLQSIGLDGVSVPLHTIEAIAAHHIEHMKQIQAEGEYYLCGHSAGAYIAFEIARQLEAQGDSVGLLAILDVDASYAYTSHECHKWDEVTWILEMARLFEEVFHTTLGLLRDELLALDSPEQCYLHFKQKLENIYFYPPNTPMEQFMAHLNVFKANMLATTNCDLPQVQLKAKLALFRTEMGVYTDKSAEILQDATWGWQQLAQQPVDVYDVPGDHNTMLQQPHVAVLADYMNDALDKVCD